MLKLESIIFISIVILIILKIFIPLFTFPIYGCIGIVFGMYIGYVLCTK